MIIDQEKHILTSVLETNDYHMNNVNCDLGHQCGIFWT